MKLLGIISVDFQVNDQLLIGSFSYVRYWRKNCSTMRQYINYSKTSRKRTILLGGKNYTEFGVHYETS
jgi:hypothetical protein